MKICDKSELLSDFLIKKHILFEIKYRNGRRIKAFESVVLQYIYELQERRLDIIGDYNRHYLIVFEELQNVFGTYSMNSDDSLELLTIFTQSRSDANIHYIGIGQRLNDISTKIVERLRPLIGLTLGERSLQKIRAMIPKELEERIQQLPKRHWIYLNGKENPELIIPEFKKEGKPTYLKPDVKTPSNQNYQYKSVPPSKKKHLSLKALGKAIFSLIFGIPKVKVGEPPYDTEPEDDTSEYDGILGIGDEDALFPPEE